ncbi:NERD domain-containing protein [Erysipelotrichaceae bacterium OH741_COT-311]|nr:NERD domain-containing protein [Erysipelotrichaceae bacterium OH741_COT-311]
MLLIILFVFAFFWFQRLNYHKTPYYIRYQTPFYIYFLNKGKRAEIHFYNQLVAMGVEDIVMNVVLENDEKEIEIDCVFEFNGSTFVAEIKNYAGSVYGTSFSSQWTHYLGKQKYRFQNPLRQNYAHTKTISAFTGVDHDSLVSVVVFANRTRLKTDIRNVIKFNQIEKFIYDYHPLLKGVVDELLPYENRKKFS